MYVLHIGELWNSSSHTLTTAWPERPGICRPWDLPCVKIFVIGVACLGPWRHLHTRAAEGKPHDGASFLAMGVGFFRQMGNPIQLSSVNMACFRAPTLKPTALYSPESLGLLMGWRVPPKRERPAVDEVAWKTCLGPDFHSSFWLFLGSRVIEGFVIGVGRIASSHILVQVPWSFGEGFGLG